MWWQDAVVYQIYPRSFQDSDGDGIGDLRGIAQRLDHLVYLGVDALWLSPIYPSPLADFGYDVSDYTAIDPVFGTMDDFDDLVHEAHDRGLKLLLDLVASHTSIEHRWFREHPDWYIWSPVDGPPNNWKAAFGGAAWSRDERSGRWYLHTFYPEQPDLDWRNPEVVTAMQDVVRFWLDRGVDGFRVDAVNVWSRTRSCGTTRPRRALPASARRRERRARPRLLGQPARGHAGAGGATRSRRRRTASGEVYLPTTDYPRYLEHLDLVFAFELLFSPWKAASLRAAIEPAAALKRVAWVLSNHDFDRLATRVGARTSALPRSFC